MLQQCTATINTCDYGAIVAVYPLERMTYDIFEVKGSTGSRWPSTLGQGGRGGHLGSGGVETKGKAAWDLD